MTKAKYLIMILFASIVLLIIPNISNAAEEQTWSDTNQSIEWGYEVDGNNIINLRCKTTNKTGAVEIPSQINGKNVVSLKGGDRSPFVGAFENCAGITEITIPSTITSISSEAFYGCSGLRSITLPNSISVIESSAFWNCSGLTSVTLPENLSAIKSYAFSNCSGIKNLIIPDTVTTIENRAFSGCSGLKQITLSQGLTKICENTFSNCTGLTSIKLPENVTTIEGTLYDGAFHGCTSLQKILIPDNVASIGEYAFQDCNRLTIYGNDNMYSKQYAEEHQIPFDYIANWDKTSSGTDITGPTVKSIVVTHASVMNYSRDSNKSMYMVPGQAKLVINVEFSEVVEGTSVPTLTIKFGNGQNIEVKEGTIGGSIISYIYTVKSTDKGVMTAVDYKGGDIKDAAGNAATLSCPALKVQYSSGDLVYANGTATNPGTSGSGSGTSGSTSNGGSSNQNDKTVATTKLPQTGIGTIIISSLIGVIGISIFAYLKYRKYKEI